MATPTALDAADDEDQHQAQWRRAELEEHRDQLGRRQDVEHGAIITRPGGTRITRSGSCAAEVPRRMILPDAHEETP